MGFSTHKYYAEELVLPLIHTWVLKWVSKMIVPISCCITIIPPINTWGKFHKTLTNNFGVLDNNFHASNTKIGVPNNKIQFSNL